MELLAFLISLHNIATGLHILDDSPQLQAPLLKIDSRNVYHYGEIEPRFEQVRDQVWRLASQVGSVSSGVKMELVYYHTNVHGFFNSPDVPATALTKTVTQLPTEALSCLDAALKAAQREIKEDMKEDFSPLVSGVLKKYTIFFKSLEELLTREPFIDSGVYSHGPANILSKRGLLWDYLDHYVERQAKFEIDSVERKQYEQMYRENSGGSQKVLELPKEDTPLETVCENVDQLLIINGTVGQPLFHGRIVPFDPTFEY